MAIAEMHAQKVDAVRLVVIEMCDVMIPPQLGEQRLALGIQGLPVTLQPALLQRRAVDDKPQHALEQLGFMFKCLPERGTQLRPGLAGKYPLLFLLKEIQAPQHTAYDHQQRTEVRRQQFKADVRAAFLLHYLQVVGHSPESIIISR